MENETKAWIAIILTGVIFLANDFFSFLSKEWSNLLLIVAGVGLLYLLVKSAIKEALKEHHFDN